MPQFPEILARRWSEAKAELEASARSGSRPRADADVDAILERIAGLIRSVGREELQAVVRASGSAPHAVVDPALTTDQPAGGKTPTVDQTGAYTPSDDGLILLDSKEDAKPIEKAARKIPTVPGYEIVGILGRGGMGVVYRATQTGLRRTVALKMILAGEHASGGQVARFAAEARAVAQIRHPGIVQIYEIGEHDGLPYFSLEFCPGGGLDKKLNHEPQPPREAAALLEHLARAMFAAHSAGVVHRDLKPANVLLDSTGSPKITDFGLARELDGAEGQTRTGSILGTPYYMAPEQALGQTREVGPAADQYSLGATLYEVLTGRPPFQGASVMETLEQVRNREPVPPSQLNPACPKDLETICLKALEKEPAKRYSSCEALADDLRAFLDGRPIAARPVSAAEKAWRWAKRNPRVAGLASLVALLLVVLAAGGTGAAVVFDKQKREALKLAEDRRIAQEAAEKALLASDVSYESARQTTFVAVDEIPTALAQAVFARAVEQQVLTSLGAMLEKQLGLALQRGLPDRALMNFHIRMGELMLKRGKTAEAEKHFRSALAITERLLKTEEKEKDKAKGNHALVLRHLGTLTVEIRRPGAGDDALKFYAEAVKLQREVLTAPLTNEIPPAEAGVSLAGTLIDSANVHRRLLQFERALPHCEEAIRLLEDVVKAPPTPYTANAGQILAEGYVLLGRLKARLGRDDEAEKALAEGFARHRALLTASPANVTQQGLTARAAREYGDFLLMRGKLDEATPLHERDLELIRGMLQTPEILGVQSELSNAYYRSAMLALKKGDRSASNNLFRKCLDLRLAVAEGQSADPPQMIRVANAQARCGLHIEAAVTMEELFEFKHDPFVVRQSAFNIAVCVGAVEAGRPAHKLSDAEKALRDWYAARSLDLLEHLVGRLKYTDVVQLKTDPDLDAIRNEPRFQALVKKLEKPPAKP